MKIQIDGIKISPAEKDLTAAIGRAIKKRYGIRIRGEVTILKKSLDARKKSDIHYLLRVVLSLPESDTGKVMHYKNVAPFSEPAPAVIPAPCRGHVIVTGSGPAGLFASLRLIEAGASVTLIERGKPVEERIKDITRLEETGKLNFESNVVFGEGGAGTYSDGKLTARTKRPESRWFYEKMVAHGGDPSILYEARPHIGTDRLRGIVAALRQTLIDAGAEILFNEAVTDLVISGGEVKGVLTATGREVTAEAVLLATGHSARDTLQMLRRRGVALEKKGTAMGLRVEHPAELIREIQYGHSPHREILPPAEYALAWTSPATKRGIYSFCMCPGGAVINSSSEEGHLCVNGMSLSGRDSDWSNAALVVTVTAADMGEDTFGGIDLQRCIEAGAFAAGGGSYSAPAQRITSFLENRADTSLPGGSYRPGIIPADLRSYLPPFIAEELAAALPRFDKRMKGFITGEAILVGAETRTSSPLRITRNRDFSSVSHPGLYPAGEGTGYAGGIVSSAVDGIRAADCIINALKK